MTRIITIAGAQLGPVQRAEPRASVVARMVALMEKAAARGATFVVFPELALTTFFPRWLLETREEIDAWFERAMPNEATAPLFE
ncbi:MAG: nitrilase-related carbon-nitrogen hydrolase, partial [Pseudomonadota bacterium]